MANWGPRALMRTKEAPINYSPIIELLVSLIAGNFNSLETINLLMRTNKALSVAMASDSRLFSNVIAKLPAMSKGMLRELFVMNQRAEIPFMIWKDPKDKAAWATSTPHMRCNPATAFEIAMRTHTNVPTMAKAFQVRKVKSDRMKKVWQKKYDTQQESFEKRKQELRVIKDELRINLQPRHLTVRHICQYAYIGRIEPLSSVYRDKMLMWYRENQMEGTAEAAEFSQIVRKDMATPRTMTHSEDLFILKHAIAWQHYLINYSNYTDVVRSVRNEVPDSRCIEFLFPLQNPWPWIDHNSPYMAGSFHFYQLEGMWDRWRARHDELHPGIPGA